MKSWSTRLERDRLEKLELSIIQLNSNYTCISLNFFHYKKTSMKSWLSIMNMISLHFFHYKKLAWNHDQRKLYVTRNEIWLILVRIFFLPMVQLINFDTFMICLQSLVHRGRYLVTVHVVSPCLFFLLIAKYDSWFCCYFMLVFMISIP